MTPTFDLVPIKVKNGFVVGRVYVRMVRSGIRTYYNIYDFKRKCNVMLNVFYKNSADNMPGKNEKGGEKLDSADKGKFGDLRKIKNWRKM